MGFRVADLAFKLAPEVLADKECESLSAHENKRDEEEIRAPHCAENTGERGGAGNCVVHSPTDGATKGEQLPDLRLQLAHTLEMLEQVR